MKEWKREDIENSSEEYPLLIREELLTKIAAVVHRCRKEETNTLIHLWGKKGSGRSFLIKKLSERIGTGKVIFIELRKLTGVDQNQWQAELEKLIMVSVSEKAFVCLWLEEMPEEAEEEKVLRDIVEFMYHTPLLPICFLITRESEAKLLAGCEKVIDFPLPMLNIQEKIILWDALCRKLPVEADVDIRTNAGKYVLNPGEIHNLLHTALLYARSEQREAISRKDITAAVRQRQQNQLGSYAKKINAAFSWEDLILEEKQKRMLHLICNQVKYRNVVEHEWGFYQKMPYGRGLSCLFYGAPGTGKTMAVQVMANELGLDIYRIDLSQLISKYIGETEKNISDLFQKAQNINAILFFDEADALFAKRSEIRDSNDRNANSMTAHLLQNLEDYEGISVLASNLINNMDDAFKRRIKYTVQFAFPAGEARLTLFQSILPPQAKCAEKLDFPFFAGKFELSGSSIKEVLLNAAYLAAGENDGIRNCHIVEAIKMNYLKYGKILTNKDFGYLV